MQFPLSINHLTVKTFASLVRLAKDYSTSRVKTKESGDFEVNVVLSLFHEYHEEKKIVWAADIREVFSKLNKYRHYIKITQSCILNRSPTVFSFAVSHIWFICQQKSPVSLLIELFLFFYNNYSSNCFTWRRIELSPHGEYQQNSTSQPFSCPSLVGLSVYFVCAGLSRLY